jgi:hypothetical protein
MSYGWRTIDGSMTELCDECGFDARTVGDDETPALTAAFGLLTDLLDHPDVDRKPDAETWSAREYVSHCVEVTGALLEYVARALGRPVPAEPVDLEACAAACQAVVPGLTAADREAVLTGEYSWDVTNEWIVRHLLHDLEHHVLDIRRGYAAFALADLPDIGTVRR